MPDEAAFAEIQEEFKRNLKKILAGKDPLEGQMPLDLLLNKEPRIIDVLRTVCSLTGINVAQIRGERRNGTVTRARYAIAYIARTHCNRTTLQQIAMQTGRFDHGTILAQLGRAKKLLETDADFRSLVSRAEFELGIK